MIRRCFSINVLGLVLLGCGGDAPDTSSPNNSGTVLDGYLSSATVFLDCNNNGELDAGEISTLTDDNGQYYFNVASSIVNSCVKVARATAGGSLNNEFGGAIGAHGDDIYVLGLPD